MFCFNNQQIIIQRFPLKVKSVFVGGTVHTGFVG